MRYLENLWNEKDIGLQEVPVLKQVKAGEDAVAVIDATIDGHFRGKSKIVGPFADEETKAPRIFGNNIAFSGKAPKRVQYRDKDNPKIIRYRFEEEQATPKHIDTATLCTRDDRGSTEDTSGDSVKPFVHLIFEDGSQLDLEAVAVKPAKKDPKAKPAADAGGQA